MYRSMYSCIFNIYYFTSYLLKWSRFKSIDVTCYRLLVIFRKATKVIVIIDAIGTTNAGVIGSHKQNYN